MLNLFLLDTISPTVFPAKTCLLNLYVSSMDFDSMYSAAELRIRTFWTSIAFAKLGKIKFFELGLANISRTRLKIGRVHSPDCNDSFSDRQKFCEHWRSYWHWPELTELSNTCEIFWSNYCLIVLTHKLNPRNVSSKILPLRQALFQFVEATPSELRAVYRSFVFPESEWEQYRPGFAKVSKKLV